MLNPAVARWTVTASALAAAAFSPLAASQPVPATPIAAESRASTANAETGPAAGPVPGTSRVSAAPDLAARFRVTWTPRGHPAQAQQWQLQRSAAEVSWIKGDGREDIWRRDVSGIRLERVLRRDRHRIDYSAGELRTLGVQVDWRALGSLLTDADLARLHRLPDAQPGAWPHYRGVLDGEQVDLRWDPAAQLPVQLLRRGKAGQVLYQRLALLATAPAHWPRAGAGTDDFQRLDAADFGDMDDNPVVRQEEARDALAGWRKPHRH